MMEISDLYMRNSDLLYTTKYTLNWTEKSYKVSWKFIKWEISDLLFMTNTL